MGITEKAVLYSHFCFSWELSEIGAAKPDGARLLREAPAAFGRLCVETDPDPAPILAQIQPPSGGCVLKQLMTGGCRFITTQPPSGGCVLKRGGDVILTSYGGQPPSGGCVLKPKPTTKLNVNLTQPPSGGCVLKPRQHGNIGN